MIYHPRPDDHDKAVKLTHPSNPSPQATWSNPLAVATVVPEGELPIALNGTNFEDWAEAPRLTHEWEQLAARRSIEEPPFHVPSHLRAAAGVVVEESDGRLWLVAPSNRFGGYSATFPKGTVDQGVGLQATALKEAWEESGLQVELTGYLLDAARSVSSTRYYLARRIGGSPAAMGWESQAVHLVPKAQLAQYLTNKNDLPLLKALS
jgi:ADP-ribose pyrophosphatase YjhB (NUDIX family)